MRRGDEPRGCVDKWIVGGDIGMLYAKGGKGMGRSDLRDGWKGRRKEGKRGSG